jgi:hypothetical protein
MCPNESVQIMRVRKNKKVRKTIGEKAVEEEEEKRQRE